MSRHSCSTAGTVAQTAMPVDLARPSPSSPRSRTAHSSAVRRSSVATRQSALDLAVADQPEHGVAVADVGGEQRHRVIPARSMPRSKTRTEWVSAPTEMKSTPGLGHLAGPLEGQPAGGLEAWPGRR